MSNDLKRLSPSPVPEMETFQDIRLESPPPQPPLSPSSASSSSKSSRSFSPVSLFGSSKIDKKIDNEESVNHGDYVTLETINNSRASSRLSASAATAAAATATTSNSGRSPQPPELPPKSYQNVLTTNHVLPVPKRGVKPYKSTPTPTIITPLPLSNDYYSEPKQQIYEHSKKLYEENHDFHNKKINNGQQPKQSNSKSNLYQNSINFNQFQTHHYLQQQQQHHQQQQQQIKNKKDRRFATALCVFVSVLTFVLVLMFYLVGESAFKSILMIFAFVTILSVFLACFYRRPTVVYVPHCSPEALETIVAGSVRSSYRNSAKNPVLFLLPPPVGANNTKIMLNSSRYDSLQVCPVHNQPVYMNDYNNNPHLRSSIGPTPPPIQTIPGQISDRFHSSDKRRNTLNL